MKNLDALVSRFLTWPVPADVWPDGTPGQPGRTGTNLMTHEQARQMVAHVLAGVATAEDAAAWVEARRDAFVQDNGSTDPDTGAVEFGRGVQADVKAEYVGELTEIAEGLRALPGA